MRYSDNFSAIWELYACVSIEARIACDSVAANASDIWGNSVVSKQCLSLKNINGEIYEPDLNLALDASEQNIVSAPLNSKSI